MSSSLIGAGNGYNQNYFLDETAGSFELGAKGLMNDYQIAAQQMEADPSNPSLLANYQAKLNEYTMFRNVQTNVVKAMKDCGMSIVQNFH